MSTKLRIVEQADVETQEQPDEAPEFTEELPPLHIDPTSFDARTAGVEPCSVVREVSKHWASVAAFELDEEKRRGDVKTADGAASHQEHYEARQAQEERRRELWLRKWEPKSDEELEEHVRFIKSRAAQHINWGEIGQMWNSSPRDAIDLWRAIRLEARDEFVSGHYGARAFEVMHWQHEAWRRAQYLAVRDGLIEEWKPRGASEFILIDQMTQTYVMQIHWAEVANKRAIGEPRNESHEFYEWKKIRKAESRINQWGKGDWDVPYQHEAEAVEQAFRMVDLCAKSFQRAARQLANIRLVRAKTARTRRRDKAKLVKGVRVA